VRRARDGETVLALDGREYTLTPEMCVIADDKGVESIAGVMGGEHSGCDENTTDVLIESALWDPLNIARTGRALGIITDARYRFERGVDPEFMVPGLELATRMVLDLCGGTPSEKRGGRLCRPHAKVVSFPVSEVKRLTGIDVPKAESSASTILTRLGFGVEGGGVRRCHGAVLAAGCRRQGRPRRGGDAHPRRRQDRAAAARRHDAVNGKILTTLQIRTRAAKRALAVRGMMEAVTWSFIPAKARRTVRRRAGGAEAVQPDRRRHERHAALAAAGPDRRRAAQCRPRHRRRRAVRGVGHL
jgi:phenylalanyl-tRNA synthetase beta chain